MSLLTFGVASEGLMTAAQPAASTPDYMDIFRMKNAEEEADTHERYHSQE